MHKRIAVIFMGGTIGTAVQKGQMASDQSAASALLTFYQKRADALSVTFDCKENFGILSENTTVCVWNRLLDTLRNTLQSHYDGIIIAHGTDTLAYTAALLSVVCKGIDTPIFLVSSHQPLTDEQGNPNPDANGVDNFAAAVTAIAEEIAGGVYVPYRNPSDGVMHLLTGEQITQCPIYSDDFTALPNTHGISVSPKTPPLFAMKPLTDCVLQIQPYVGLNYRRMGLHGVKAVLHGVYHSGTACVDDGRSPASLIAFAKDCEAKNIPVYLAPAKTSKEQTVYASVPALEQTAIRFCYGHTNEWLYTALLYAYSQGLDEEEINQLLQ